MKHDFKYFPSIAGMEDLQAAKFLDTAVQNLEDFRPAMQHIERFGNPLREMHIIDFGCGLGRNLLGITDFSDKWVAYGYDNPKTIERAKRFYGARLINERIVFYSDWDSLAKPSALIGGGKQFDLVFASLVMQHIDPDELRSYLRDIARISKRLYVAGRRALDWQWSGNKFMSVWKIIGEFFEPIELEDGLEDGDNPHDHHYGIYEAKHVRN